MNKEKKIKSIPHFKTEDEEREFWATHDTTEYFDMDHPLNIEFPNLKFSTKTISLRLPQSLLDDVKQMANRRDVPYQSFIKMILADRVQEEKGKYKV